ncbi:MAG: hypothetical protein ACLSB9_26405 [Hydrogeniiclostridium mannosilyticum]
MDDPFSLIRCGTKRASCFGHWRAASADSKQLPITISERTAANLKEAMEQGNNILGFLKSGLF